MIFSNFFKSKFKNSWQHKDSNNRIEAVNSELKASDKEQYQILIDLLENDPSDLVRRAVLLKLASFDVWLNTSLKNSNDKVREFADKQVMLILLEQHDVKISFDNKMDHIANQSAIASKGKVPLLESWLKEEQGADLIIALYKKIDKPQLAYSLFINKKCSPESSKQVQLYLVNETQEQTLLERFIKKACDGEVSSLITEKLAKITELTEKPKKLRKQIQLLLSKLLALKEVKEYQTMVAKRTELQQQWQIHLSELHFLNQEDQQTFQDKYNSISEQISKSFAQKAEAFEQDKIAAESAKKVLNIKKEFEQKIVVIRHSLATAIYENTDINEQDYQDQLQGLLKDITSSILNETEQTVYCGQVNVQLKKLSHLPLIAQSVTEATHLISRISQLAVPTSLEELNERQPIFNEWKTQWNIVEKQAEGVIPDSIYSAYKEIMENWQKGLKPLIKQQQALFTQTQKKIAELKRLITNGKFNASFGVFKKVNKLFEQCSASQKHRLQKEFESVSEKMSELSDWEHYIATPRKQQLLADIKAIVENPLDNPNEQAAKVKQYRKTWNSLGHADDEIDKSLNEEFNAVSEQAFAPCRLYYAEQEKLREQHLSIRLAIIEEAKPLASLVEQTNVDWKNIDTLLNQLQRKWQSAGEVDRNKYKLLQADFKVLLQPAKTALRLFYQQNSTDKKAIILKAELEVDNEDLNAAIENVKVLQSKWREIGYAGPKDENKLWQNFRAVNDALFGKRDQQKAQEKLLQTAQKAEFEQELLLLKEKNNESSKEIKSDMSQLTELIQQSQELFQKVIACKPVNKALVSKIEKFSFSLEQQITEIKLQKTKQNWQQLFDVLESIADKQITESELSAHDSFLQISSLWRKKLQDVIILTTTVDRQARTLALEILAGIDSPGDLVEQRMQVQVSLMQEQMSSGGKIDLQEKFIEWLLLGALGKEDVALLQRLKPIYC
ncbi:MAG: DUF349 domain-containing protein [Alteromonadaceae bacterium]|nr:DUF349 domain-containing protein [Alteromonadaceae bacterium]